MKRRKQQNSVRSSRGSAALLRDTSADIKMCFTDRNKMSPSNRTESIQIVCEGTDPVSTGSTDTSVLNYNRLQHSPLPVKCQMSVIRSWTNKERLGCSLVTAANVSMAS